MNLDYNEIKVLKGQYSEIASQIERKSDFVFRRVLANSRGHVCDGFDCRTEDDGTRVVWQNVWDGFAGTDVANTHVKYPFRWLNMGEDEILGEYREARDKNIILAHLAPGTCSQAEQQENSTVEKRVIDEDGREWHENEVVMWYMLMPDESTQYEMVCPYTGKCVEYFLRKDDAIEYAKNHNLVIAEWL